MQQHLEVLAGREPPGLTLDVTPLRLEQRAMQLGERVANGGEPGVGEGQESCSWYDRTLRTSELVPKRLGRDLRLAAGPASATGPADSAANVVCSIAAVPHLATQPTDAAVVPGPVAGRGHGRQSFDRPPVALPAYPIRPTLSSSNTRSPASSGDRFPESH